MVSSFGKSYTSTMTPGRVIDLSEPVTYSGPRPFWGKHFASDSSGPLVFRNRSVRSRQSIVMRIGVDVDGSVST